MDDRFLTDDEEIRLTFRAHWRSGLLGMTMTVVLGVGGLLLGMWVDQEGSGLLWGGILGLLGGLVLAALVTSQSLIEWLTTQYWVTSERLVVRTGLFTRKGREIPVDAINSVAIRQNAVERMLGYGDMAVESAGANSLQIFKNIPKPLEAQKAIYESREARTIHLSGGGRQVVTPERGKYADLADLADLRDRGVISDAEFDAEKAKILQSRAPEVGGSTVAQPQVPSPAPEPDERPVDEA
jgi:membrane protein YdbS with pleckstrin-like domain